MNIISIALVQPITYFGNVLQNVGHCETFIDRAGKENVDLIVFPELYLSGYDLNFLKQSKCSLQSEAVQYITEIAKKNKIYVILPVALQEGSQLYNAAILITRNGDVEGIYRKVHLWSEEKKYFQAGNRYPVFQTDFGKIGILICYDAGFPEASRMLALHGAELIVFPAAFADTPIFRQRWNMYFGNRALENTCFVAAVNSIGLNSNGERFCGNNLMYGPDGLRIAAGTDFEEQMEIVKINLDTVKEEKENSYLTDLRMDTYEYRSE